MKILKLILMLPFIILAFIIASYLLHEFNKSRWDGKIKRLCAKDGGTIIVEYENLSKAALERNKVNKYGNIRISSKSTTESWQDYYHESHTEVINKFDPYVWRTVYKTYRKRDGNVMQKTVYYSRRGGDMPTGIGHDSSFSCSDMPELKKEYDKSFYKP